MATLLQRIDLGTEYKLVWSDTSVTFEPKLVLTAAQKAAKLAAFVSGVNDLLTNEQLRLKLGAIKAFYASVMGEPPASSDWMAYIGYQGGLSRFVIAQFNSKLSPARLSAWQAWDAARRDSMSSGVLGDIAKSIDQAVDANPLLQVIAPMVPLTGEVAKHPVEAAALVFTAGAVSTLALAPVAEATLTLGAPVAPAAPSALSTALTAAQTYATETALSVGAGIVSQQKDNLLAQLMPAKSAPAPVETTAPVAVQKNWLPLISVGIGALGLLLRKG